MSRKLVATLCLSLASIGEVAAEAAATELGAAADMQTVTPDAGQTAWPGYAVPAMTSIADPVWFVRHASEPEVGPRPERRSGGGFATHRAFDFGGLRGAAAAAVGLDVHRYAAPAEHGGWAGPRFQPSAGVNTSVGGAVGLQFGQVLAGPFSSLTYAGTWDGDASGMGTQKAVGQSLAGSVGLQASTRFDTALGPAESHFRLSLDHDFLDDAGTIDSTFDPWRRNIYMEEVDASRFDFENAIVFLKYRGRVPGWFFYETRVRVRTTGIKAVTGRIWIKW